MVLALEGGFLVGDGRNAWWVPPAGDAVALGPADYLVPSGDRTEAWIVSTVDEARRVTHVDGRDGALRLPRQVFATPNAAVRGGQLVQAVPPTFTNIGRLELWDPESNEARTLPIAADYPAVTGAAGDYILWFDQMCRDRCIGWVTNAVTGESRELPSDIESYSPTAASPSGERVYLRDGSASRLVLLDLATLSVSPVPGSAGVQQWAASLQDVVVFDNGSGGVFMWQPGWEDAQRLSTAGLGDGAFALR
jgi:hypothetical protein